MTDTDHVDIAEFARRHYGVEITPWQQDIAERILKGERFVLTVARSQSRRFVARMVDDITKLTGGT